MRPDKTIKVLLLEDDEDYYRLLLTKLRRQPTRYEIEWCAAAADAVEKLQADQFDVILSDLTVPDSKGPETVTRLREFSDNTPIIVLTGLEDNEIEEAIIASGGQDYLVKGDISGAELSRSIQHAIQRQHAVNENLALLKQLAESHEVMEEQTLLMKKKNRRLRRLNKMAHEFVDNVSHDFRTPLTVIKDYVSLIREGLVGDINDEQRAMLDKVGVRADDLNNMVDDLLDVSKLDSGLLGCWRRSVDPVGLLERAESMLAQRAAVKGVEFSVECPADLPEVYCDSEKAERAITNLAVNAIKFSNAGGKVRLWAEPDPAGQQVVIGVTDDGPGIDPDSLRKMFERFQQETPTMKPQTKGFGLGLSIAQKLTHLNLGELSVKSQVGSGSTFSFTLPFADATEVFRRWLGLRRDPLALGRLVEITVAEEGEADDFDYFLNSLLRRNDLLLRVGPARWLLVLIISPLEASRWRQRLDTAYAKANRNRPTGPLTEYQARTLSRWNASDSIESRVRILDNARKNGTEAPLVPFEVT